MSYRSVLIIIFVQYVAARNSYKSSLTFVIDDTMSMHDDIKQVMEGANAIFDEVGKHESSQIENFIFLTFNDYDFDRGYVKPAPGIKVRADTKDPKIFKDALQQALKLHGNYDCAEYAMSGIKKGLEISLPGSYIYVFTDASAKDYKMFEEVKRIAQQKQSQIVFVLTGKCKPDDRWDPWPEETYQIYYEVAKIASGEVFNIERDDVNKILEYVKISIQGRRRIVAQETLQPGENEIEIRTDDKGKTVTVSLTSDDPFTSTLKITAVDGSKPSPEVLIDVDKVKLYKINLTTPGVQKLNLYVSTKVQALVTAKSGVTFQHGFSLHKPLSINSTSTRPLPDTTSYLSIQLVEGDIELKSVRLLGMDKKVMTNQEYPLELINNVTNFYVTEPFNPPDTMFWIEIVGYDPKTETNLMRMSLTPVEAQKLTTDEKIDNKPPSIFIEGDAKITAEFEEPLELICAVNGYPKPDIVWKNKDSGIIISGNVTGYNLPYDYISILTIDRIIENATYQCTASNIFGTDVKEVTVETIPIKYFRMLESPKYKRIKIEYEKEGKITCMVEAYPPAEITWYKNAKPLLSGGNIEMSYNKSIVTIKNTTPSDKGKYMCEARNADTRILVHKYVTVTGVERPVIDKHIYDVPVKKGSTAFIDCKILKGRPKPSISWFRYEKLESEELYDENELDEWKDKERVVVKDAGKYDAGTYRCQANNEIGTDNHAINLVVEYPPTIVTDTKQKKVKADSEISISCEVDGGPAPNVTWHKDGVEIQNNDKFKIFRDFTLRFTADLSDKGVYTCEARNGFGTAIKNVNVEVFLPVRITKPQETSIGVQVGDQVYLLCEAKGFPEPTFEWMYSNFNHTKYAQKKIKSNQNGALLLDHIQVNQEGYYTCVARNSDSYQYLSYEVYVYAPPTIENTYKIKHFTAVEGDLALRIRCIVTGNPKPTIIWSKDGHNLALGTTYLLDGDTFIITNVPKEAQGIYTCGAVNFMGSAQEIYEVTVEDTPSLRYPKIVRTEERRPTMLNCEIPHNRIDQLRWYRDGKLIQEGELTLPNPEVSDSGHYICRVSNFFRSSSGHLRLEVGQKPKFTSEEEEETIELVEGPPVSISCIATGLPSPTVSWFYNGERLSSNKFEYQLSAKSRPGQYKCEVKNEYGVITRTFDASPRDCYVRRDKLTALQPLIVTSRLEWPAFETTKEYLLFPKGQELVLYCPSTFKMFPRRYLEAFCDGGMMMLINGEKYDYADIECNEEISHSIQKTGNKCMATEYGDTELVKIGYTLKANSNNMVNESYIDVYEICMDNDNNVPIYSFHFIENTLTDENNVDTIWSDSNQFPLNFTQLYDCDTQINTISSWLGKWFHRDDKCCFAKRQLVNPRDVFPGPAQRATYSYLNVVPQWSSCNADNWKDVEQKVRDYARSALVQLLVWTGTSKELRLHTAYSADKTNHFFTDRNSVRQPIPVYFWKVIQDPLSSSSLAIIQVNVPDLSYAEINKYILCEDICHQIDWMNNPDWHLVERGYVYCCSIEEFKKSFGLYIFEEDMDKLLTMDVDTTIV